MPFCPICQAEFREGFTRCNACDVDLVDQLEEDMDLSEENVRAALEGKELVGVTRGPLDVVKETRELLAANRIASIIIDDEESPKIEGLPPRMVLVVPQDDIEAAAKVLGLKFKEMVKEEGMETPDLKYENCPACGTRVSEDAEECSECGLFIGKA
jgi:predicted amidophosphoribosyltransferase